MSLHEYFYIDVEDYLLIDTTSKTAKYEYLDGVLYMLAGRTNNHSIIAANITTILNYALRKKPCIVYSSDVRVKLSESKYVHPDVTISCDKRDSQAVNNIQYPQIVIEVLSPSTEAKDKREKLLAYLKCPSLEEYILIDSRTKFVEVYHKENNKWTSAITQSDDIILLPSISLEISIEDIYAKTSTVAPRLRRGGIRPRDAPTRQRHPSNGRADGCLIRRDQANYVAIKRITSRGRIPPRRRRGATVLVLY